MKNIDGIDATDAVIGNVHRKRVNDPVDARALAHIRGDEAGAHFLEKAGPAAQLQFEAVHPEIPVAQPRQRRVEREKGGAQQALFPDDVLVRFQQFVIVKGAIPDAGVKEKVTQTGHLIPRFLSWRCGRHSCSPPALSGCRN